MADWYDDFLGGIGIDASTTTGPTGGMDMSNNDIMDSIGFSDPDFLESIGMALGNSASQSWVPQTVSDILGGFSGINNTAAYAQRQGFNEPRAINETAQEKGGTSGGIIGRISDFVDKNKGLSEMLAKGIASAATGNSNQKTAEINARSRLDELKLKNEQERQKSADVSASVSGLRAPTGIINRGVLKRADGTPVYQNGRIA